MTKHEGCCGECYYWEERKHQRGVSMREGDCHWLPESSRTDFSYWCGQWEISDEAQEAEELQRCRRKIEEAELE